MSLWLSAATLYGQVQTTTAIMGTVRDATGAVLPGVTVTIVHQATGVSRERVTNNAGDYSFQSLQPGTYAVRAALSGFRTAVITDREALVAIPAEVDIVLQVGDLTEEVTISAAGAELLNTTTAELATTIDEQLVDNMPIESRNYFDVLALAPNTSPQYLSTANLTFGQHSLRHVSAAGSFESSGVLAGGQRDSSSNVSIDIWEGGHRVPFIVRWPGKTPKGVVSDELIELTDLLATVAALLDTELPTGVGEDSRNVLPALLAAKPERPVRDFAVHHSHRGIFALRKGPWKMIPHRGSGGFTAPRDVDPQKVGGPPGQLYNLDHDPSEAHNVWEEHPAIVDSLNKLLAQVRGKGQLP